MPTIIELGKKVKLKYPGTYDDLSDFEVGKLVKAKYPDAYADFSDAKPEQPSALDVAKQYPKALQETFSGFGTGVLKGVGSTLLGASELGEKLLQAPLKKLGIKTPETAVDRLGLKKLVEPKTTAEKLGFGAEQIGEFFVPGGASVKAGKAAQAAVKGAKAGRVASLGARALTEAGLMGGQTALQTGELGEEAKLQAEIGAAFPIAGAGLKVGTKGLGMALTEVLGRSTGAGSEAIREAYKNPNVVNFMRQANIDGIDTLQKKIVEDTRVALNVIKEEKRKNYLGQLSKIKDSKKQFDSIITQVRSKAGELLSPSEYNIRLNTDDATKSTNFFDFSKSTITEGEKSIAKALEDVFSWSDNTPGGLDVLKKRLSDYVDQTPFNSPSRALLTQLKNSLSTSLKQTIPGYEKMVSEYSVASDLIDEMTKALSLGDKAQLDTTIRKLMSTVRQNNELRKSFVDYLTKIGGKDIMGRIAGVSLAPVTPRGLQGVLSTGIGYGGGVAALFQPQTIPITVAYLMASSPRLVGEFVSLVGKIGHLPKEIINKSPAIRKQIQRIFGEAEGEFRKPQPLFQGLNEKLKGKIGLTIQEVSPETAKILRGTKGMTADDIMATYPNIKLKKDIPATMIDGTKAVIPKGEKLTPYELKGNKILLQDGETYIVSKNQFQNIKGQSVVAEGKPFAPELQGLEETVKEGISSPASGVRQFGGGSTKYSQYQLPEGKNYREILIKAPDKIPTTPELEAFEKEMINKYGSLSRTKMNDAEYSRLLKIERNINQQPDFQSSHWEEPNVLSHLRMNERTYKGKKVAFMEELQSDWARELRKQGKIATESDFKVAKKPTKYFDDNSNVIYKDKYFASNEGINFGEGFSKEEAIKNAIKKFNSDKSIPEHPLLKNWQEPTIKRALKEAVDSGADYFAWINGEQTSARYNLATHLDNVKWEKEGNNSVAHLKLKVAEDTLSVVYDKTGKILPDDKPRLGRANWQGKKLDEVLGKGLADKIMSKESGTLSGEGLKFGGEWATNLYDKQVPNIVKDLTGGKVEVLDMGLPIEKNKVDFTKSSGRDVGGKVSKSDLKIGLDITDINGDEYIITDILGDGKFKAVKKQNYETGYNMNPETFDISEKTTKQMGIRLTPEIKAKIKGIAPKIKTSNKMFQ